MLTRSAILATTLAIGLVGVVGSSALAVAFVPGNESGSTQDVPAIAIAEQDPAEGTSSAFLAGVPTIVSITAPIVLDAPDEDPADEVAPVVATPATDAAPPAPVTGPAPTSTPTPTPSNGNNGNSGSGNSGNGNSGSGNSGNPGHGNSGKSPEDKAKEDKAKKDKEDKAKKDKEDKAKEDKAKKDKEDKAKKDKNNAEGPADEAE